MRKESEAPAGRRAGGNRTQLLIGGIAVAIIGAVIVSGFLLNRSNTEIKNDGYGTATQSVATLGDDGVISVANGSPAVVVDVYEDPICPFCGAFERQFGQQMAQAVDEGRLAVNYHPLNFLDPKSGSGDYSSRANAALMCTASHLGADKGVFAALHEDLYAEDVQPAEGDEGLTDDDLIARITTAATGAGVSADDADLATATACVTSGEMASLVDSSYAASAETLTALTGSVRSPVIVSNGVVQNVDDGAWLDNLLAG